MLKWCNWQTDSQIDSQIASRLSPMFLLCSHDRVILLSCPTDPDQLRPATPDEIAETLSYALRYHGGYKRLPNPSGRVVRFSPPATSGVLKHERNAATTLC